MDTNELLKKLSKLLKNKGFAPEMMFNEGVDNRYLDQVMGHERIHLGKDILDLYAWHNGSPMSEGKVGDVSLFCGSIFLPFEFAWLSFKYFNSEPSFAGRKLHFPFMQDGSGVFLFIDCDQSSATKDMIYEYDISRFPKPYQLMFENIEVLISGTVECLETNIYKRNSKGQIDIDFRKQNEVFAKLNPSLPYWRE